VDALREVVEGSNWQCVGSACSFNKAKCTVLYAISDDPIESSRPDNIAVFSVGPQHQLFAIDTLCPHEGIVTFNIELKLQPFFTNEVDVLIWFP
jgi:nitrite reductase/ring-hydroxylating ferredoxin subunit